MGRFTFETLQSQKDFQHSFKTADQTINSNSTFFSDADMFAQAEINTDYWVEIWVLMVSHANRDWKYRLLVPTGSTSSRSGTLVRTNIPNLTVDYDSTQSVATTTDQNNYLNMFGHVRTGATGGELNFQWAQGSSGVEDTTLFQGSHMTVLKLS